MHIALLLMTLALGGTSDETSDLRARINRLEADIAAYRSGSDWLTEARATEIRTIVGDVLADADARAGHLNGAGRAGWDGRFFIENADDTFQLDVTGHLQSRYVYSHQHDPDDGDPGRGGFELRRAKVEFRGHIIDRSWRYRVRMAFHRASGLARLEDASIRKRLGDGWTIEVGQFKAPFLREHGVSSKRQLAVERSLVNGVFNQGRTQGVEIEWEGDAWSFAASINDGIGRQHTASLAPETDWAFTARTEFIAAGDRDRFSDFTSWPDDEGLGLLFGAALLAEQSESGTPAVNERLISWTLDASLEHSGMNAFAAIIGRSTHEADRDELGIVLQGGVFVAPGWEVFARYEWGDADRSGVDDLQVLTAGLNRYFSAHSLKWTTDVGYAFDSVHDDFASSGAGWREDESGESGQIVIRTQFQLLF